MHTTPLHYCSARFDSARDEVIATLASVGEGFGSRNDGDVESPTGYFAQVTLDASCDLAFDDHTNYPSGDYAGEVARTYGVTTEDVLGHYVVRWDERGFVYVDSFDSPAAATAAYDELEAAYVTWVGDDD